jgi:hypothetical protein
LKKVILIVVDEKKDTVVVEATAIASIAIAVHQLS